MKSNEIGNKAEVDRMIKNLNREGNLPFIEGYYYHIYSQPNSSNEINNEIKFSQFERKFIRDLNVYFHLYAYCLLPDHFHFLGQVKGNPQKNLASIQNLKDLRKLQNSMLNKHINKKLSAWYRTFIQLSSGKAAGKMPLKQKMHTEIIDKELYFSDLIFHIHYNPVYHNIYQSYQTYPWSSYKYFLNGKRTPIKKKAVLQYFSGKQYFIQFHEEKEQSFAQLNQKYKNGMKSNISEIAQR